MSSTKPTYITVETFDPLTVRMPISAEYAGRIKIVLPLPIDRVELTRRVGIDRALQIIAQRRGIEFTIPKERPLSADRLHGMLLEIANDLQKMHSIVTTVSADKMISAAWKWSDAPKENSNVPT